MLVLCVVLQPGQVPRGCYVVIGGVLSGCCKVLCCVSARSAAGLQGPLDLLLVCCCCEWSRVPGFLLVLVTAVIVLELLGCVVVLKFQLHCC